LSGLVGAGLLLEDPGHFQRVLHPPVRDERDHRGEPGLEPVGQPGLDEPGGVLQAVQGQLLLPLRPHHRDEDLGVLQVPGHLRPGDRHHLHPRVAEVEQDRLGRHLADHLGDALQAVAFHGVIGHWSLDIGH